MVDFVTDCANEKTLPLLARMTLLTEHAIVTAPGVLEGLSATLRVGKAVWVKALTAEVAAKEVLLVAERATEITHLLKHESWILKAYFDRVRVPAGVPFIIRR